jgi:uncharacterized protein YjbI with pentapeptide repeats
MKEAASQHAPQPETHKSPPDLYGAESNRRKCYIASLLKPPGLGLGGYLAVTGLLAVILLIALGMPPRSSGPAPDCKSAAAPGVNWRNCKLESLRLRGANLTGADLRNARLAGASYRLRDWSAPTDLMPT